MDNSASSADGVAGLLQNLHVEPRIMIHDTVQVLPNPNAVPQVGGFDPSRAGMAEASNTPASYGGMEAGLYYPSNGYASHNGYYIGGYDYPINNEWENYMRHNGSEVVDPQIRGSFGENWPRLYHPSGFAFNPQQMFAPYAATPSRGDGQSYNAPIGHMHTGNIYQQSVPPNSSLIPSSTSANDEASRKFHGDSSNKRLSNVGAGHGSGHSGARPVYSDHPSGPYGRAILPLNGRTLGSQDVRVGYGGNRIGTVMPDLPKVTEGQHRHGSSSFSVVGPYGRPLAPLLPSVPSGQMYRPRLSVVTPAGALGRGLEPPVRKFLENPTRTGVPVAGLESQGNGHHWYGVGKSKSWSGALAMPNSGSSHWDILNEQNKGLRTVRGRHQRTNVGSVRSSQSQGPASDARDAVSLTVNKDQFNRPDFVTTHDSAKFFIIKSYSEDDVHKSIKYSMWASTVNGNKKLDVAYREAQASAKICPLFLFFSVNASGQFCGVAEMIGPVDFNSSLDFWQQDKWTGKLPVKWHIVKDVPNSQFRHIVLENNDNKPVTNSRDTQEVPLSQGSEMLNIFKTHGLKTSILDDFLFYETRQRFMQEKKARQQTHVQLQQTNRRGSKVISEKSGENEAAQSTLLCTELPHGGDHTDKVSKPINGPDRVGSFKGGVPENSQSEA